jgi:hypothetical protein
MAIGFQESLNEDFERLKLILCLPEQVKLPSDEVHSHKNPENLDKRLDPVAIENLKNWYQEDYKFLALCRDIVAQGRLSPALDRHATQA